MALDEIVINMCENYDISCNDQVSVRKIQKNHIFAVPQLLSLVQYKSLAYHDGSVTTGSKKIHKTKPSTYVPKSMNLVCFG